MKCHSAGFTSFHPVPDTLETARPRFTGMKRLHSLSFLFHANIPSVLMCPYIKYA
jgi:hypothetical protein